MKNLFVIAMLCVSLMGFSQEKNVPEGGAFGLIGTVQPLWDQQHDSGINVNPRIGIGARLHLGSLIVLEALAYCGFSRYDYATSPDSEYWMLGIGLGVLFWVNTGDDFSVFFGPKFWYFSNDQVNNPSNFSQYLIAGMLGAQYSFSKHFAVFLDLGIGFEQSTTTNSSSETNIFSKFRFVSPTIGFIFYL